MAAVRRLGLLKLNFLTVGPILHQRNKFYVILLNFIKIDQTVAEISRFL